MSLSDLGPLKLPKFMAKLPRLADCCSSPSLLILFIVARLSKAIGLLLPIAPEKAVDHLLYTPRVISEPITSSAQTVGIGA